MQYGQVRSGQANESHLADPVSPFSPTDGVERRESALSFGDSVATASDRLSACAAVRRHCDSATHPVRNDESELP